MGARSCRLPGHAGRIPGRHSARPTACRSPVRGVMRGRIGYREGQSGARGGTQSATNHAAMRRIACTSDAEGGLLAPGAGAGVRLPPPQANGRATACFFGGAARRTAARRSGGGSRGRRVRVRHGIRLPAPPCWRAFEEPDGPRRDGTTRGQLGPGRVSGCGGQPQVRDHRKVAQDCRDAQAPRGLSRTARPLPRDAAPGLARPPIRVPGRVRIRHAACKPAEPASGADVRIGAGRRPRTLAAPASAAFFSARRPLPPRRSAASWALPPAVRGPARACRPALTPCL